MSPSPNPPPEPPPPQRFAWLSYVPGLWHLWQLRLLKALLFSFGTLLMMALCWPIGMALYLFSVLEAHHDEENGLAH